MGTAGRSAVSRLVVFNGENHGFVLPGPLSLYLSALLAHIEGAGAVGGSSGGLPELSEGGGVSQYVAGAGEFLDLRAITQDDRNDRRVAG